MNIYPMARDAIQNNVSNLIKRHMCFDLHFEKWFERLGKNVHFIFVDRGSGGAWHCTTLITKPSAGPFQNSARSQEMYVNFHLAIITDAKLKIAWSSFMAPGINMLFRAGLRIFRHWKRKMLSGRLFTFYYSINSWRFAKAGLLHIANKQSGWAFLEKLGKREELIEKWKCYYY